MKYCIKCGSEENLTKHHVLPLRIFGKNSRTETLCEKCHKIIEKLIIDFGKKSAYYYKDHFNKWLSSGELENLNFLKKKIILVYYRRKSTWNFKLRIGYNKAKQEVINLVARDGCDEAEFSFKALTNKIIKISKKKK